MLSAFKERISFEVNERLSRLQPHTREDLSAKNPKWHRSCYASFTSSNNIRLARNRKQETNMLAPDNNVPCAETSSRSLTRTAVPKVDWNKCVYCQTQKRENVHQVQSAEVEHEIQTQAKFDNSLKCKIGENDLIAYEAHYHSSCKYQASRNMTNLQQLKDRTQPSTCGRDIALEKLVQMLDIGFSSGHVYSMDNVTEKYVSLMAAEGIENATCRPIILRQKLRRHYGDQIAFRRQRQSNQPLLLMSASVTTDIAVSLLVESTQDVDLLPETFTTESSFLHALHTVVTKIRSDLKQTAGHQGFDNLTTKSAEACIPNSLYL